MRRRTTASSRRECSRNIAAASPNTLSATVIADYQSDASPGLDVTEAYMDWRPIPKSENQQQIRFGAFYPPLSRENADLGWQSPFTYSYSAINTWLGEEVRPIGVEWSLHRRLGFAGSPHELRAFASAFYGNDPAGTLLFWRGWSLHDRQTRLGDTLPMPPSPIFDFTGSVVGHAPQSVQPIDEIDHRPGAYAGVEWSYARRVLVQLARYDNRADPYAYRAANGRGARRSITSVFRPACRGTSGSSPSGCKARPIGFRERAPTARCRPSRASSATTSKPSS